MSLSTAFAGLRKAARTALFAAATLGLSGAAHAQDTTSSDVFVGVFKDSAKPIVFFIFSDPASPEMKEIGGVATFARPGYAPEPGKQFDPSVACLISQTFSMKDIPDNFVAVVSPKPIYGPNSDQKLIDPITLPSFMAREAVKNLVAAKLLTKKSETSPYFNCTGFMWASLLNQPPEFWNDLLKKMIEEERAKGN